MYNFAQVVGDQKFIINETVHVQKTDLGHIYFKLRTVDIEPAESNDQTTEGVENDATINPNVDIDEQNTTQRPTENDDDGNRIGSPEILDDANEITQDNLEQFEVKK